MTASPTLHALVEADRTHPITMTAHGDAGATMVEAMRCIRKTIDGAVAAAYKAGVADGFQQGALAEAGSTQTGRSEGPISADELRRRMDAGDGVRKPFADTPGGNCGACFAPPACRHASDCRNLAWQNRQGH